jgi:hypothetical protein
MSWQQLCGSWNFMTEKTEESEKESEEEEEEKPTPTVITRNLSCFLFCKLCCKTNFTVTVFHI